MPLTKVVWILNYYLAIGCVKHSGSKRRLNDLTAAISGLMVSSRRPLCSFMLKHYGLNGLKIVIRVHSSSENIGRRFALNLLLHD